MSEIYEAFKDIHDSAGMVYLSRQKVRAFSYHIFRGNLEELRKGCEIVENPKIGLKLMSEDHRGEGIQAHKEISRLFHNFLAAAQSLVEHTRVFVRLYYSGSLIEQSYNQKVTNELANSELCRFIQDLRNYMLHKGLPKSNMSLTISKIEDSIAQNIVSNVNLDIEKLQEWEKWSSLGKQYLAKADKNLNIAQVSNEYGAIIIRFYEWFDSELEKYHKPELEELKKLQKRYQLLEEQEEESRNAT